MDMDKEANTKRACHGCGKPTTNYWCPACWRKRAKKYGFSKEDIPGKPGRGGRKKNFSDT